MKGSRSPANRNAMRGEMLARPGWDWRGLAGLGEAGPGKARLEPKRKRRPERVGVSSSAVTPLVRCSASSTSSPRGAGATRSAPWSRGPCGGCAGPRTWRVGHGGGDTDAVLIDSDTLERGRRILARMDAGEVRLRDCTEAEVDAAEAALWVAMRRGERMLDSD